MTHNTVQSCGSQTDARPLHTPARPGVSTADSRDLAVGTHGVLATAMTAAVAETPRRGEAAAEAAPEVFSREPSSWELCRRTAAVKGVPGDTPAGKTNVLDVTRQLHGEKLCGYTLELHYCFHFQTQIKKEAGQTRRASFFCSSDNGELNHLFKLEQPLRRSKVT